MEQAQGGRHDFVSGEQSTVSLVRVSCGECRTNLQSGAHDLGVAGGVKGVVNAPLGLLHQHLLDGLGVVLGVDALGRSQRLCNRELARVGVQRVNGAGLKVARISDGSKTQRGVERSNRSMKRTAPWQLFWQQKRKRIKAYPSLFRRLNDGQAHSAETPNRHTAARLHLRASKGDKLRRVSQKAQSLTTKNNPTLAVLKTAPKPVDTPQPNRHISSKGALSLILAQEISATTVYSLCGRERGRVMWG